MREEYPRMNWRRNKYTMLNGKWKFMFDNEDKGLSLGWNKALPDDSLEIIVPFAYQTKLSGINDQRRCDVVWYERDVLISSGNSEINFGAIDYESKIYIDGELVKEHTGGETLIKINYFAEVEKKVRLTVRVFDPSFDESIPRGKQTWNEESHGIWYTPTTGIWQSVWIDYVGDLKISRIKTLSRLESGKQEFEIEFNKKLSGNRVELCLLLNESNIILSNVVDSNKAVFTVDMYDERIFNTSFHGAEGSICWSPDNPVLFDYKVSIYDSESKCIDELQSYFGFREIRTENGMTVLNNNPYYFKLVLDQGYWKDGLLTAPTDEDYIRDIKLAKQMGFNGCRKHQKVEDPRFLYWADKLGFIVWGEVSSCPMFNEKAVKASQQQWFDIIERDYNNPCIVAWVPLNESWGVPFIRFDEKHQAHSLSLYYQIKSLDNTRLVVGNDGWEQTKTDICAIHNYNHGSEGEKVKQEYFKTVLKTKENLLESKAAGKPIYANGFNYENETPIMITEFGGVAFDHKNLKGWGYTCVKSSDSLLAEYKRILSVFTESEVIFGYCYTQLYDVEQEVNGLLTYEREAKCNIESIKEINDAVFIKY